MKRIVFITGILFFAVAPLKADLYVADLGSDTFSGGITVADIAHWGEAEPITSGGGYGGFGGGADNYVAPTTATWDYLCRMVWGNDASGDLDNYATITYPEAIDWVRIRHLDGSANDSFRVEVDGNLWGTYTGHPGATGGKTYGEQWFETVFTGTPGSELKITVTASEWTYRYGWGQLGIDRVEAVPVPGAVLLGMIGLGFANWRLRRRKMV